MDEQTQHRELWENWDLWEQENQASGSVLPFNLTEHPQVLLISADNSCQGQVGAKRGAEETSLVQVSQAGERKD